MKKDDGTGVDVWESFYRFTTPRERIALILTGLPFLFAFTVGLTDYSYMTVMGLYMILGMLYLLWRAVLRLGVFAKRKFAAA